MRLFVLVVMLAVAPGCLTWRAPEALYGTRTAYPLVPLYTIHPQDTVQGCKAVYLWHLLRHGTTYPKTKTIQKLSELMPALQAKLRANAEAGRTRLSRADMDRLLSWTLNATVDQANKLHAQGERDHRGIGECFKARYPAFFKSHARHAFDIRSTDAKATLASAAFYGRGVFGHALEHVLDDKLLRSYKHCPAWDKAVYHNTSAHVEELRFWSGTEVRAALVRVSSRLGFEDMLSHEEVKLLYKACQYDQAWYPTQNATWCAAFVEEDRLVFEYGSDLWFYDVAGYGNGMNLQLGCPLVQDLVERLSAVEAGNATGAGAMYFTDSLTIIMTLARLGVWRDAVRLTADNYAAMKYYREWHTSEMSPFAANVAVTLYECPRGEKYKMRMHVNEHPVAVEGCAGPHALCSWTDFKRRFATVASECSLAFCKSGAAAWTPTLWLLWIVFLVL